MSRQPTDLARMPTDALLTHTDGLCIKMGQSVALAFTVPNVVPYDWRGMRRAIDVFARAMVDAHRNGNPANDHVRLMDMLAEAITLHTHHGPHRGT